MGPILNDKFKWFLVLVILALLLLWYLSDILAPFIIGAIIAYLLDPLADKLQSFGISRLFTALMISVVSVSILIILVILILPIIFDQANQVLQIFPTIVNEIYSIMEKVFKLFGLGEVKDIDLVGFSGKINEISPFFIKSIFGSSIAILNFIFLLIVAPIVAIYLLVDWDKIIREIEKFIPRRFEKVASEIALEMHITIASFLRGQISVCIILALFYAVCLTVIGLKYGLLLGIFSGFISFIPLIGAILGGLLALIISLSQYWQTPEWVGVVLAIFLLGQFLEGNILTPRLVGKSVKLHPLWIIFSIAFFGTYLGWVGVILAVPLAACIAVLVRFSLKVYFDSDFYQS